MNACAPAWFVMFTRGVPVNALVFMGLAIAIGAIVNDVIVDVENIRRRLAQARTPGMGVLSIVSQASAEMRSPMLYATLMLLLLTLPFYFFEGVVGAFLSAAATSYIIAVLASLVVAMTLTPALSFLLLSSKPSEARVSSISSMLINPCVGLAS